MTNGKWRLSLLLAALSGCAICHAPPVPPNLPADVEVTAFIDQRTECWTLDVKPAGVAILQILADTLKLVVGARDE